MAMEEVTLELKRAKPREHRVRGIIHFKYSGRNKEVQEPNEPTFWKTVDKHLKEMGFMGPYPRDEDEKKLYTQMREHPERKYDLTAWTGEEPENDEKAPAAQAAPVAPQPTPEPPKVEPTAPADALQAFAENVSEDKAVEPAEPAEEESKAPVDPEVEAVPSPDELKLMSHGELQALCHKYELNTLGNKNQLRSRIENFIKKKVIEQTKPEGA